MGRNPKWTRKRCDIFFAALAEVCNVAAAAEAAGFERKAPYNERRHNPEFEARWEKAIGEGYAALELEMLERARFGENRPADVGESGPRQRAIPTGMAMQLLKLHKSHARGTATAAQRPMRGQILRNGIEARLAEINRRLGGQG